MNSELEHPILVELGVVLARKRGIICESVHSEFQELVSMCGGQNEKLRAGWLLNHLQYVIWLYILVHSLNNVCIICALAVFDVTSLRVKVALSCFFTSISYFYYVYLNFEISVGLCIIGKILGVISWNI